MSILEPLSRDTLQKITRDAQQSRAIQKINAFCSFAREKALQAAKIGEDHITLHVAEDNTVYITEISLELAHVFSDCSISWGISSSTVRISWD